MATKASLMYAVIFKARIKTLDDEYAETAEKMRTLAMQKYACSEFIAVMQGDQEIAISYWNDLAQIKQWKQDAQHLAAQALGQEKWYSHYLVQITEVLREYEMP